MKVLFVYMNTGSRSSFPIGLANLATYVKSAGHQVEVFDTTFYKQFLKEDRSAIREKIRIYKPVENPITKVYTDSDLIGDLFKKIESFQPDLIGFSILSAHFYFSVNISRKIKEKYPFIPIIFGGLHPSLCPEETLAEPSIDMICRGEGEYAVEELLEKMQAGKHFTDVRNLWIKQDGKVYKNALRELVDLNKLPVLDWGFFSEQHIHNPLNGHMWRIGSVEFSRGCPYSCDYCSCTALRNMTAPQKYLRHKNTEKAIADLVTLKEKYNIEMFYFLDESFLSMNVETLKDFAQEYKKRVGIPFYGMTHPNSVTEEKVKIIEDMGCYLMTVGIECGNEEFRAKYLNRKVANSKIIEAFDIFHRSKVIVSAFAMLGLPFETRELVFDTIELVHRCHPETYAVGIFKPFIGSKLRQMCIDHGFFDPKHDSYNYPVETSILNMPQFPREEIEKLHKTFVLYTKVDKKDYPLIRQAETDDVLFDKLIKEHCS